MNSNENPNVSSNSQMNDDIELLDIDELNTTNTNRQNQTIEMEYGPIQNNIESVNQVQESIQQAQNSTQNIQPIQNEIKTQTDNSQISRNNDNNSNNSGNSKYIMLILIFVIIIGSVILIPNISNFFNQKKLEDTAISKEKITSGTLKCTLSDTKDKLSYDYTDEFEFVDNKLETFNYVVNVEGDTSVNGTDFQNLKTKCDLLKEKTNLVSGISVTCSLSGSSFVESQVLTYASIDPNQLTSAYAEAGGVYPEFEKDQNIDDIESNMKTAGYTCVRYK